MSFIFLFLSPVTGFVLIEYTIYFFIFYLHLTFQASSFSPSQTFNFLSSSAKLNSKRHDLPYSIQNPKISIFPIINRTHKRDVDKNDLNRKRISQIDRRNCRKSE
ncbi:unnamed protein product [Trifolium pratense]|uniref:Uncharacterized protein n=1 Tax=Trifolium pratense TaxID=57577 RepID=A0ACB0KHN9_TRIPR|nr:unnamed protein product [Trifolium pratense]